jgi:chromosome segregation ATPase
MSLSIVLHPDKEKLNELQKNIFSLSHEFNLDKSSLNETLAKKDQVIDNLQAEKAILEYKNNSLITAIELLEKELRKSKMAVSDCQRENLQLSMKTYQYKGAVEKCADKIQSAVTSRVGFLPRKIQKHYNKIKSLKVCFSFVVFLFFLLP